MCCFLADDALQALKHGVDGIVVSNHGGRQLDSVPAAVSDIHSSRWYYSSRSLCILVTFTLWMSKLCSFSTYARQCCSYELYRGPYRHSCYTPVPVVLFSLLDNRSPYTSLKIFTV